ncbi:MAG: YihY/virulence factor BrkB family protein [Clostridia bacterium]|nr:YihY/virulence factor BrkB family protein [Clostridia bacterium]
MRGFILKIKNYNKFKSSKKAVTFAGGLVFFFLLGLVPTLYLFSLTLSLFGKELSHLGGFFITEKFSVIREFVFLATENIGAGGSVIAGFIAVYSAGSLFVHLRYTGEVIYNQKSTSTILVRILSIIASITVSLAVSFLIAVYGVLSPFFLSVLGFLGKIINFFIAMFITFIAVIIINLTACPQKIKIKEVIKGSLFTCVFSVIFTAVFLIYLKYFSSYDKIYGKIAVIPIFFAWLFIIMRCLVSGITINAYERLTKK